MPTFSYNTILPIAGMDEDGRTYHRGNVTTLTAPTSQGMSKRLMANTSFVPVQCDRPLTCLVFRFSQTIKY